MLPAPRQKEPKNLAAPRVAAPNTWAAQGANVLWLSLALLLVRVVYLQFVSPYGLAPDEAQYWHWLSHPQLAYVTKPPLTTWLMGLSTALFGDTLLGVRLFALLAQSALPLLAFALAGRLTSAPHRETAAWLAFGLTTLAPLIFVGGLIMSPDVLLTPLWLAAIYLAITRILPAETTQQPRWYPWLLIGLLIGLGGLAKASAAFFFPLLGLFFLLENRQTLARPHFWAAGLVALACQFPVLLWNAQNHWVSISHILWQSAPHDPRHGGFATLLNFLASQAGVLGPVTFLGLLAVWGLTTTRWKSQSPATKLLVCLTLPLFLFFVLETIHAKVQPNWPMLATIPALILLAVFAAPRKLLATVLVAGLVLNLVASLMLLDTPFLRAHGLPPRLKIDPTKEMLGYPELGNLATGYLARMDRRSIILTSRYETAAELAFYTHIPAASPLTAGQQPGHPLVLYLNPGDKRLTQYDFWPWPAAKDLADRLVLYVNENGSLPQSVAQRFGQCHLLNQATISQGQGAKATPVRMAGFYLCWQYHGPNPTPGAEPSQTVTSD